jgi:hypothetical protein
MASDDKIKREKADREQKDWQQGQDLHNELVEYGRQFGMDAKGQPIAPAGNATPDAPQPQAQPAAGNLAAAHTQATTAMAAAPQAGNLGAAQAMPAKTAPVTDQPQAMDLSAWARFNTGRLAIMMKHGAPVEALKGAYEYVRKLEGDEKGRTLVAALSGDEAARAKYAADNGTTPDKITFGTDPKTGRQWVDMGTGTGKQDVTQALHILAGANAYQALTATADRRDGDEKHAGEMAKNKAQVGLMGAQTTAANAAANLHNAQASVAGVQKQAILDDKAEKNLMAYVDKAMPKIPDATDMMGKAEWVKPKQWVAQQILGQLADGKNRGDQQKMAAGVIAQLQRTMADADADLAKLKAQRPDDYKALLKKYDGLPAVLRQAYIESRLN